MGYEEFEKEVQTLTILNDIGSFLTWDQEVMMPEEGIKARSKQSSILSRLEHQKITGEQLEEKINSIKRSNLDEKQEAILREVERERKRSKKVPEDLNEKISKKSSEAVDVWKKAREENDFSLFKEELEELVELKRKYAQHIEPDREPYKVLFEDFEPYLEFERAEKILEELKDELSEFFEQIKASKVKISDESLRENLSDDENMELARMTAETIGFDFDRGRLDTSTHPFTLGNQFDTRITTRFKEDSVAENIAITLHETGHALYNLGTPEEHYGTPLGEPRELVIHESQSRLWENHVGRSEEFWKYFSGELEEISDKFEEIPAEKYYRAVNKVRHDNLIRTEADEVSYHLHIILRFELERKLINGEIEVEELPELWSEKMEELLGVRPDNDAEGVLQDIHWGWGSFGYFPTYSLGSVLAAQLYSKAEEEIDGLDRKIERGEFEPLLEWLREKIHKHGQLYTTEELIEKATGEKLKADYFLEYVKEKYGELYEVEE